MTTSPNPIVHALSTRDVVFLTGATGFLGGELVRKLRERAIALHALVRSENGATELAKRGVVVHRGDLTDAASVERALTASAASARASGGKLLAIHAGALISYKTRDREAAWAINVDGTRAVLAAAKRAGVERLVFTSSVVAVGSSRDGRPIDETATYDLGTLGVDYATTKRASEELVLAAANELDVVVVNPGAIFGATDAESNTVRFIRRVAEGRGPLVAPPGAISVVGLADTADATIAALERGRRGERYVVVESFVRSRELFERIASEVGGRPPRFTLPRWMLATAIPLAALWDRVKPIDLAPPQALRMLGRDLLLDGSKARRELDWRPRPFADVLHETIAELRRRGRVP